MKNCLQLFAASMVVACLAAQADTPAVKMPPELGAAYGRLGKAILARDENGVKEVWDPDLVVNAPNNTILRREEVIAAMQAELLAYRDFRKVIEYVGVHGNSAIVMGHDTMVPLKGPGEGKPVMRRFSDFWLNEGAGWRLVARQATIAAISD
jgi:hypothetical protein